MEKRNNTGDVYNPVKFPEGTRVKIADLSVLQHFMQTWKAHDRLKREQLTYAGEFDTVVRHGIYFGGDVIYKLNRAPGVWHQVCLSSAED